MHLPGPLRAAVGLAVTAAGEAKRLPDRAIELPMLAVSTALQVSLRAQQRYARLAERGDAVLNRRAVADDPPAWATFDDPLPTADPFLDPTGAPEGDITPAATGDPADPAVDTGDAVVGVDGVAALPEPADPPPAAAKKTARAPRKTAAKRTNTTKTVRKPRTGAPSRFDSVEDD